MGFHRTPYERKMIVEDFFKSNTSLTRYSLEHHMCRSTLSDWVREYKYIEAPDNNTQPFYDITTNLSSNNATPTLNQEPELKPVNIPKPSTIKLSTNNFTLEFDISNLKQVIEVLK